MPGAGPDPSQELLGFLWEWWGPQAPSLFPTAFTGALPRSWIESRCELAVSGGSLTHCTAMRIGTFILTALWYSLILFSIGRSLFICWQTPRSLCPSVLPSFAVSPPPHECFLCLWQFLLGIYLEMKWANCVELTFSTFPEVGRIIFCKGRASGAPSQQAPGTPAAGFSPTLGTFHFAFY